MSKRVRNVLLGLSGIALTTLAMSFVLVEGQSDLAIWGYKIVGWLIAYPFAYLVWPSKHA